MAVAAPREAIRDITLTRLVDGALRQQTLSGVGKMLQELAGIVRASGCILWEASPFSDLKSVEPTGHLFVLAQWFPEELTRVIHDLPFSSTTGEAVLKQRPENVPDVEKDHRVYTQFIKENEIRSFCT